MMAPVPITHVAAPGRDRLGRESEDSMLPAMILLAQLHCSPNASRTVECWDAQKGGGPVLKVEPNLFGGFDLRQRGGKRPYLPATPEEFVRQGFIAYLLDRLGLPHRCLRIEKGVPTLGNGGAEAKARGRFDLVLYEDDRPLLLVEFKRETETESLI